MGQIKRNFGIYVHAPLSRALAQAAAFLSARVVIGVAFSCLLMVQGIVQAHHYGFVQTSFSQIDNVHQILCLSAQDQNSLITDTQSGASQNPHNQAHHDDCAFCPACSYGVLVLPNAFVLQNPVSVLLSRARPNIFIHAIASRMRLAARPREPPIKPFA